MYTDHTPGYGSAAKYIATILKEVICDSSVYNIRSVTVAEISGPPYRLAGRCRQPGCRG